MTVSLVDMDIYSAEWVSDKDYKASADPAFDLVFSSFAVVRQVREGGNDWQEDFEKLTRRPCPRNRKLRLVGLLNAHIDDN